MKKLEKLEKYVRVPDVNFYGTYFYDGEDIELHNKTEEIENYSLTIIDKIENGIFYKHKVLIDKESGLEEVTDTKYPVKEGEMLAFAENVGFTKMRGLVSIEDAINRLKMLDSNYFDEEGNIIN